MIKSLYAKLALTLIVLLFVTAVVYSAIAYYLTRSNIFADVQRDNANIAANLSNEVTQTVSGQVDSHFVERLFRTMATVNPDVQLYLLDPEGVIVSSSVDEDTPLVRNTVTVSALREFLSPDRQFPLFAEDPLAEDSMVTFSVAEIVVRDNLMGYLYITLNAHVEDAAGNPRKLISTIGVWALLGSLLVSLLGGLYIFRRITRRLRVLSSEIEGFRESGFRETTSYKDLTKDTSDDEIAKLGASYDEMANRIVDQIHLLEAQDKNRRSFIANISHDLRTPLTATQGYLEMVQHKNDTLSADQRAEYIGIALKHSNRLAVLIRDLFELAKLEDHTEKFEMVKVCLTEVIGDVHQGCIPQANAKNIKLECIGADKILFVNGDLALLDRAVGNLLVNAIEYTPADGEVTVTLDDELEKGKILLSVEDNGPGIAPEELKKIFKRFHRADNEHNEGGNAGLGLAITQRIVELHGDTLVVENTGNGTRFSFWLASA